MYVIRACTILIALNLADAFLENIINEAIVSLQENIYGKVWTHICTGVLVGKPQLMLTAAHCFENKMDLVKERPGIRGPMPSRLRVSGNLGMKENGYPLVPFYMYIERVELHPQWNVHGKIREAGDIAMVHLKNWNKQLVKFIGLLGEQNAEILPYFSNCTLLGWSYNQRYIEGQRATRTSVTVMSTDICNNFYKEFQHFDSKICVQTVKPKAGLLTTCPEDKAALLICKDILSSGYGLKGFSLTASCGKYGVPALFVNLDVYRDWIKEVIKLHRVQND